MPYVQISSKVLCLNVINDLHFVSYRCLKCFYSGHYSRTSSCQSFLDCHLLLIVTARVLEGVTPKTTCLLSPLTTLKPKTRWHSMSTYHSKHVHNHYSL